MHFPVCYDSAPTLNTRSSSKPHLATLAGALTIFLCAGCLTQRASRHSGLWDFPELSKAPTVTWGATNGLVQELFYAGEPLNGKPTRVFAYLGRPTEANVPLSAASLSTKPRPAMVLVHGGGG